MPPLYAIPTTSGTGSEVGRSGVIILRATGKKTIFFHPKLMPDVAVLEPSLTAGLPPHITVATGIDAFTHCLEAYFVDAFHPLADGIAQEGIRLVLKHLPIAYADGSNLESRGAMQMAAAMGATAFQKGLGMIHSLAHPLSARYNTHHGLANALLLPDAIAFLESRPLGAAAKAKICPRAGSVPRSGARQGHPGGIVPELLFHPGGTFRVTQPQGAARGSGGLGRGCVRGYLPCVQHDSREAGGHAGGLSRGFLIPAGKNAGAEEY